MAALQSACPGAGDQPQAGLRTSRTVKMHRGDEAKWLPARTPRDLPLHSHHMRGVSPSCLP